LTLKVQINLKILAHNDLKRKQI